MYHIRTKDRSRSQYKMEVSSQLQGLDSQLLGKETIGLGVPQNCPQCDGEFLLRTKPLPVVSHVSDLGIPTAAKVVNSKNL
jgi:hypothetical protein